MSKSSDWLPNGREGPLGAAGECAYSVGNSRVAAAIDGTVVRAGVAQEKHISKGLLRYEKFGW
jgi:hypothetical protein